MEWFDFIIIALLVSLFLKLYNLIPKKRKKRGRRKPTELPELKGETVAIVVRLPLDIYQKLSEQNQDVAKQIVLYIERLIKEQNEGETNGRGSSSRD